MESSPLCGHYLSLIMGGINIVTTINFWAGSQLPVFSANHNIIVTNLLSAVIQLPKAYSLSD